MQAVTRGRQNPRKVPIRSAVSVSRFLAALVMGALAATPFGCRPENAHAAPQTQPAAAAPHPNMVFVLIDTLRADRLGCYGNPRRSTPALDAIAAEGVRFDRAIAPAPWTQPSMASLFASVHPGVHQVLDYRQALKSTFQGAPKTAVFSDAFQTLAEMLQSHGYATAGFVANPYLVPEYGFAQGFDHYDASFARNTTPGSVVNAAAAAWLRQRDPAKPFFLYLHYMDSHGPYGATGEFLDPLLDEVEKLPERQTLTDAQFKRLGYLRKLPPGTTDPKRHERLWRCREYWAARYEAGVRQVDHFIAELRDELDRQGLWKDAYVIVTADHGEALCEHGWWEHGWSVHDTDLHVPLILRCPSRLPVGDHVPQMVRLIDLMPTLLDQLQIAPPAEIQGRSMNSLIGGHAPAEPPVAFAEAVKLGDEQKAVYVGNWKLQALFLNAAPQPRYSLYDLANDPQEQNDLARRHPEQVGALADLLRDQLEDNARRASGVVVEQVPLSPEQIKRLKSLGYLK